MGLPPKWWVAATLLFVILTAVFSLGSGSWLSTSDMTSLSSVMGSAPTLGAAQNAWDFVIKVVWWQYPILLYTPLGQLFRDFLLCLSAAVILPVGYAIIVLIGKPLGGS